MGASGCRLFHRGHGTPDGLSPSSGEVTAKNVAYNAAIPVGGSIGIGFQATHTGDPAAPSAFSLNGAACTLG